MKLTVKEIVVFSMLGAVMFASKIITEALPNIHLLAMFITAYTVVFRKKALIPIYVFVFLTGLYYGFNTWWVPYLYIWTLLWVAVMLLPKNINERKRVAVPLYMTVAALHGFLYGVLYAPFQALIMGFTFKQTLAWIAAGFFPFDIIHGVSNFCTVSLTLPLANVLKRGMKMIEMK